MMQDLISIRRSQCQPFFSRFHIYLLCCASCYSASPVPSPCAKNCHIDSQAAAMGINQRVKMHDGIEQ